jgi:hypothetical protein
MKDQGFGLVRSFLKKVGGSHQIEDVKERELKWCHKMWVQEIMVLEHELLKNILLHV